jgi:hypothetical protein
MKPDPRPATRQAQKRPPTFSGTAVRGSVKVAALPRAIRQWIAMFPGAFVGVSPHKYKLHARAKIRFTLLNSIV